MLPRIRHRGFWGVVVFSLLFLSSMLAPAHLQNIPYRGPSAADSKARLSFYKTQLACLTEAIYYESGNQSRLGKEAVAIVILNRERFGFAKSICGVIRQSSSHPIMGKVCQFSYHCMHKAIPNAVLWKESQQVAKRALTSHLSESILTHMANALYFHAVTVHPYWAEKKVFVGQIGDHLFYREDRHYYAHHRDSANYNQQYQRPRKTHVRYS